MRRALLLVALTLALAPAAHADGDPASDYLYTQQVFVPFDVKAPPATQSALHKTVAGAAKAGYPIRVAVIGSAYDLGAVPSLWRKPKTYARFLGEELGFVYKQRLLIVMPNGFGFFWKGHDATKQDAVLTKVKIGAGATGLVEAATTAVVQLAAADGVHVAAAQPAKSTANRDRIVILVAALAIVAAAVLARVLLRRRRRV